MSYVIHTTGNGAKGDNGNVGQTGGRGVKGDRGDAGKSAYDIWLECGNVGSEQDFIDSLRGRDGNDGVDGNIGQSISVERIMLQRPGATTYTEIGYGNNGAVVGGNLTVSGYLQVSSHTISPTHTLAGIAAYTMDGTLVTFPAFPSDTTLSTLSGVWGIDGNDTFNAYSGVSGHMVYWGTDYALSNCSALTFNGAGTSNEHIYVTDLRGNSISVGSTQIYGGSITTAVASANIVYTQSLYASQDIRYNGSNPFAMFTYPVITAQNRLYATLIGDVNLIGNTITREFSGISYTIYSVNNFGNDISVVGNNIKVGTAHTDTYVWENSGGISSAPTSQYAASNTTDGAVSVDVMGGKINIGQPTEYDIFGTIGGILVSDVLSQNPFGTNNSVASVPEPYKFMMSHRHQTSEINLCARTVNIDSYLSLLGTKGAVTFSTRGYVLNGGTTLPNTIEYEYMVSNYTRMVFSLSSTNVITSVYFGLSNIDAQDPTLLTQSTTISYVTMQEETSPYIGINYRYKYPSGSSSVGVSKFHPLVKLDDVSNGNITIGRNCTISVNKSRTGNSILGTPPSGVVKVYRGYAELCSADSTTSSATSSVVSIHNGDTLKIYAWDYRGGYVSGIDVSTNGTNRQHYDRLDLQQPINLNEPLSLMFPIDISQLSVSGNTINITVTYNEQNV